jgi:hypothetical protein
MKKTIKYNFFGTLYNYDKFNNFYCFIYTNNVKSNKNYFPERERFFEGSFWPKKGLEKSQKNIFFIKMTILRP